MNEKVLLFLPNTRWFGKRSWTMVHQASLILTALLKDDYEFVILDANGENLTEDQCRDRLRDFAPDVTLTSALSIEYSRQYHAAVKLARETCPETITVMGGVYPHVLTEEAAKDGNVDYLFLGHAEERVKSFLRMVLAGDTDSLASFPGIGYRDEQGQMRLNPVITHIGDVKQLVRPDYSLTDLTPYLAQKSLDYQYNARGRAASILTSYGCPYNCSFCANRSINGRRVALRPCDDVLDEIGYLVVDYRVEELVILDDCFAMDRGRVDAILDGLIARNYGITWKTINVCAWHLDRELLELMKRSGCTQLTISVESGSQRVVKDIIHKPLKLDILPEIIANCKRAGIDIGANFVIGLPGETWDEIRQTFRLAESLDFDVAHFHIATPLPHTEMYRIAKAKGYLPADFSFTDPDFFGFGRGFITTEEFTPDELAVLRAYEWDRINFSSPEKELKIARLYHTTIEQLSEHRKQTRRKCGIHH